MRNYRCDVEILRSVYIHIWMNCAGWNRVPFFSKQLLYVLRTRQIKLRILDLGGSRGYSRIKDEESIIALNKRLFPASTWNNPDQAFAWLDRPAAVYTRFVFLHEIGHMILHNSPDRRTKEIKEIEADFFAYQAIIPDHKLLSRAIEFANQSQSSEEVYEDLETYIASYISCAEFSDDNYAEINGGIEFVSEFATYRLSTFRNFARSFYYVSSSESQLGKMFNKVQTVSDRMALSAGWDAEEIPDLDLLDIVRHHPNIMDNLEEGEEPFRTYLFEPNTQIATC